MKSATGDEHPTDSSPSDAHHEADEEVALDDLEVARTAAATSASTPSFSRQQAVSCLKGLAVIVRGFCSASAAGKGGEVVSQSDLVRAMLNLTSGEFVAPARPPLPSPPGTPPPQPLATSQFVWDALGRPDMADGSGVHLVHL